MNLKAWREFGTTLVALVILITGARNVCADESLTEGFAHPPASARPWVYWYFMDGNLTREGMRADLEAMQKAGIGGAIFLEVNIGVARGPVDFMSPQWQELITQAMHEADRLGIQLALGSGPGWCGTGGPWIPPELAMQHLVASRTNVVGPMRYSGLLARPQPRMPYFGAATLTPGLKKHWQEFYCDIAVLAYPTPKESGGIADVEEKALYHRDPYSSKPGVKPFLPAPAEFPTLPAKECINTNRIVELTAKMSTNGLLEWDVPAGEWTILRLGRTITGQTTRPAPQPGLGFESDKFNRAALDAHFGAFIDKILAQTRRHTNASGGLTMLHFDSWEMGSQNWSPHFREEFQKRRGYDPLKFLPAFTGEVVDSPEITERFLWDVRHTAQELVVENHVGYLATLAHKRGLTLSVEPYDLNPAGDLTLGRVADVPQCEFWHLGFDTTYSVTEAASIGHTCGRRVVAAEAFTSVPGEDWKADPAALKTLGDWAFCEGVNRFDFHRFQAQPWNDRRPGMTMGPYGVHWDRTQTWWDMAPAYHEYLARCQFLLQRGTTVADICFLAAEGAPHVFRPPRSAVRGTPPAHGGYNFDGCAPETLLERATVKNGNVVFPGGTTYRILVLPECRTMTPKLLRKIESLVRQGATVFGRPPTKSPSLESFPRCDTEVKELAHEIWGDCEGKEIIAHSLGRGRVLWRETEVKPGEQYGDYAAITNVLSGMGVPPDFDCGGPIRFTHRRDGEAEIYFLANGSDKTVATEGSFRVHGLVPQLWNPLNGEMIEAAQYTATAEGVRMPLAFGPGDSMFVVFRRPHGKVDPVVSLTRDGKPLEISPTHSEPEATVAFGPQGQLLLTTRVPGRFEIRRASGKTSAAIVDSVPSTIELGGPWQVNFDPQQGGPENVVVFDSLDDWSKRPETGIKCYSGVATYRTTFVLPDRMPGQRYFLDLGQVKNLARIRVNGVDCGVVWCPPWRVEVTGAVARGTNQLEIAVANLWPNRLIGDLSLPENKRISWTTYNPFKKDSLLLPSGLLGPVRISTEVRRSTE